MSFTIQRAELAEDLLRNLIAGLPVIDIHTHISPLQPGARNLGEVVFYHYVLTELRTAGLDTAAFEKAPLEHWLRLLEQWHPCVANTSTWWCLRQIMELLGAKGFSRRELNEADAKLQSRGSDSGWVRQVLVDCCHIQKTLVTLNITEPLPSFDEELFAGALRVDEAVVGLSAATARAISSTANLGCGDLHDYEEATATLVEAFANSGGRTVTIGLPPDAGYSAPGKTLAAKFYSDVLSGGVLTGADRTAFHSYLLRHFATLARELRLPFQMLAGVRRPLPGGVALPVVEAELIARYAGLFHEFSSVHFDLFLASAAASQELVAAARNYPNVNVSGHWWFAFSPPHIRGMLLERLYALPVSKVHAFFSDAYNVEWSYGKIMLYKRELAHVLAEMISGGYLAESQAESVARQILYDNPKRFYRLAEKAPVLLDASRRRMPPCF